MIADDALRMFVISDVLIIVTLRREIRQRGRGQTDLAVDGDIIRERSAQPR